VKGYDMATEYRYLVLDIACTKVYGSIEASNAAVAMRFITTGMSKLGIRGNVILVPIPKAGDREAMIVVNDKEARWTCLSQHHMNELRKEHSALKEIAAG